jgi:hypothetical protein
VSGVISELTVETVTLDVIAHLERRRYALCGNVERTRAEVTRALEPWRRACLEDGLPEAYGAALERELTEGLPERWCADAERLTDLERNDFDLWRRGDVIARCTYAFLALIAVAIVAATGLPLYAKLAALACAIATWWLPSAQVAWHRYRYAIAQRELARTVAAVQARLDRVLSSALLLPAD